MEITNNTQIENPAIEQIIKLFNVISDIKTPSFVRILNYSNDKSGNTEVANYLINMGTSYQTAKDSDTVFLLDSTNMSKIDFKHVSSYAELARRELLLANEKLTVESVIRSQAQIDAYINILPNIKIHRTTGRVFICGMIVEKEIIKHGVYRPVNSAPLTIAKNCIRKHLKCRNFREFAVDKISQVRCKGEIIEIIL